MSGTKAGGLKARRTNLQKHGNDFYARIGAMGGRNGHTGGFASNPPLARIAGRKGGRISTRKGIKNGEGKWRQHKNTYKILKDGKVVTKINIKYIATDFNIMSDYNSLAELNEKWEDASEEPKEYWYITDFGYIFNHEINDKSVKSTMEEMKSIGNYFKTKEEAVKAVEKLKAWKRLKDKGFEFCCDIKYENLCGNGFNIPINAIMPPEAYTDTEVNKDLDLLFGGEE